MKGWVEANGLLPELQNGFRERRRLGDNLFVLTQFIEIARKESRSLVACFLDVAKAYDSIPHDLLLSHIQNIDMPSTWVDLLQRLYNNSIVIATFGQTSTDPVSVRRGLKQGCLISPLLYCGARTGPH
ncbi:uncharacterized protein LOC142788214 [Rhipicephalus microplus]|uniref:uncharacterized protein LOC142788214 n=1 Tax=Rhipicephalus microplus TaxID=6941 RepID=UPI003F6B877D